LPKRAFCQKTLNQPGCACAPLSTKSNNFWRGQGSDLMMGSPREWL
jgi:hypothetical protein